MKDEEVAPGTAAEIEFWFDFASGYAYFAALDIEALAARHGRAVLWRPFTLGSAFKVTGASGLSRTPLKREYARLDWERLARWKRVPFRPPESHPMTGLPALRAFYAVDRVDKTAAAGFAKALLFNYFAEGVSIDDAPAVAETGSRLGLDPQLILSGIVDPEVKYLAREHGEAAVRRGVFGSPWIFVDGEPFWGHDRLAMIEYWLSKRSW